MLHRFDEFGCAREEVLAELGRRLQGTGALKGDFSYESGRIVGSMISAPHPFAASVFAEHLEKNLGDPGLFPQSAQIERETVAMLGDLLSHPEAVGQIMTGGGEANIVALWAARELRGRRGRQVIVPDGAHFSYEKAARLLGLDLRRMPIGPDHRMDMAAVKRSLCSETIAIVGIAGSTELGLVDPMEELSDIALEHDLFLHVDAAFGGYVLPFLKELGLPNAVFDFSLPGVSSIAINPHKMGLCVQPAGGLLFRDADMARSVSVDINYLAGGKTVQISLTGTRSGAAVLAVWAMLKHFGREGYRELVRTCMERTHNLAARIQAEASLELIGEPFINILGVRPSHEHHLPTYANNLRERGWAISEFPEHIRIVALPHLSEDDLDRFCDDLVQEANKLRKDGVERATR